LQYCTFTNVTGWSAGRKKGGWKEGRKEGMKEGKKGMKGRKGRNMLNSPFLSSTLLVRVPFLPTVFRTKQSGRNAQLPWKGTFNSA
jgi:hypothetical protein